MENDMRMMGAPGIVPMPVELGMVQEVPVNVEAAIEQAIDEMDRKPVGIPGSPLVDVLPVLELQEADMIEEKTLKNGHEVKEEVIETPDRKVIKVTEEGPGARNVDNIKEVKDELTKEFEKIQPTLQPGPGEAMRIHEETGPNA